MQRHLRPTLFFFWLLLLELLLPTGADAHMQVKDSALYSGLRQPFGHWEGIIFLVVLSVWAGVAVRPHGGRWRSCLFLTAAGIASGVWIGIPSSSVISVALLSATLLLGLLVAADRPGPGVLARLIAPAGGILLGIFWREGLNLTPGVLLFFCAGITVCGTGLAAALMAMAATLTGPVARTGVRILASWACAVSAMLLAYAYRSGQF